MVRCRLLIVVPVILLAACSRSGVLPQTGAPGEAPAFASARGLTATVNIRIPNAMVGEATFPGLMHQAFVAASTRGALVRIFKHGKDKHPIASVAVNLAPKSKVCKKTKSGRNCSIVLDIPAAGTYDFTIDTYDKAPKGGKFPTSAKQLAAGFETDKITKSRRIKFVLGGIVASTQTAFGITSAPAIDPFSALVTVVARDADGNVIVTDKYVNDKGRKVTLTMSAGTAAGTTIAFTPPSFHKPSAVTLTYTPANMSNAQATNGFTASLFATATNGAPPSGPTLTFPAPSIVTYAIPSPGSQEGITAGPDGALWFTSTSSGYIGRATTTGMVTDFSATSSGGGPNGITSGPGGLWFAGSSANSVNLITTSGSVTSYNPPTPGSYPSGITVGPDGNLWFTESNTGKIGQFNPTTKHFAEFPLPLPTSYPYGITTGPDGALWFTECEGDAIVRMTTGGTITNTFPVPSPVSHPFEIVTGKDGALWFSSCSEYLGRVTTSGAFSSYSLPGDSSGVTTGPDGAIWFTVVATPTSPHYVGRMSNGVMTLYQLAGTNPYPTGIVTGPDGAIWFVELNGNVVGRLQ